jgi:hypothetical protein
MEAWVWIQEDVNGTWLRGVAHNLEDAIRAAENNPIRNGDAMTVIKGGWVKSSMAPDFYSRTVLNTHDTIEKTEFV